MSRQLKILVPVDFSTCSSAALQFAASVAEALDGSVDVLHVWEPSADVPVGTLLGSIGRGPPKTLGELARGDAEKRLTRFIDELGLAGKHCIRPRVEIGEPDEIVLTLADEDGYDLIVVGTHGRGPLSRLLVGSVAERILRHASCPVVTVSDGRRLDRNQTARAAGF
jgi:nucleotide-binding universal stress UspA family protein